MLNPALSIYPAAWKSYSIKRTHFDCCSNMLGANAVHSFVDDDDDDDDLSSSTGSEISQHPLTAQNVNNDTVLTAAISLDTGWYTTLVIHSSQGSISFLPM